MTSALNSAAQVQLFTKCASPYVANTKTLVDSPSLSRTTSNFCANALLKRFKLTDNEIHSRFLMFEFLQLAVRELCVISPLPTLLFCLNTIIESC